VPPEIAEKSVEIVASKDKEFRIAPGGHMGVIIGSKAQNAVWAESAEWLAKRSSKTPSRATRKVRKAAKHPSRSKRKVA
jgi:polyhydroxyalkanoate synthase